MKTQVHHHHRQQQQHCFVGGESPTKTSKHHHPAQQGQGGNGREKKYFVSGPPDYCRYGVEVTVLWPANTEVLVSTVRVLKLDFSMGVMSRNTC